MKNLILRYGLYSGALSAVLMGVMTMRIHDTGNMSGGEVYGYAGMILSMLFVYLGVKIYRDRDLGGVISFGEAFKVGGLIALISCVCYVVAWMLLYEFVMPDFLEKYITKKKFYGLPCDYYFIDIGIPEDYSRFINDYNAILSKDKYIAAVKNNKEDNHTIGNFIEAVAAFFELLD